MHVFILNNFKFKVCQIKSNHAATECYVYAKPENATLTFSNHYHMIHIIEVYS